MLDQSNRRISFTWLREKRTREAQIAAGWSGVMSLPRMLSLNGGELNILPVPELQRLRRSKIQFSNLRLSAKNLLLLEKVTGDCLEIIAEFLPGNFEEVGLILRATADGAEQTRLFYRTTDQTVRMDTRKSSLSPDATGSVESSKLNLRRGETLVFNVFLDASTIEVFVNGRACISDRVYPTRADAIRVGVFVTGSDAKVRRLEAWTMQPISPDRLTSPVPIIF